MFEKLIAKRSWQNTDTGLLVLRIGVGLVFILAGFMKVKDLGMTVQFFSSMGIGAFWAYLVSFVEFLGGISVLVGIFTRLSAKLLAITMIVATYIVRNDMTMVMTPLILVFANITLLLAGAGKYSLSNKLKRESALN